MSQLIYVSLTFNFDVTIRTQAQNVGIHTVDYDKEPGTVRPNFGPQIREKIERGFTWFNHDNYAL